MERHEILEAMSELKLFGMRANFDEIAGKGLDTARRDLSAHCQPDQGGAHAPAGPLHQLSYQRGQVPGAQGPGQVRVRRHDDRRRARFANWQPARSSTPSATRSSSAARAPAKPISALPCGISGRSQPCPRTVLQPGRSGQSTRARKSCRSQRQAGRDAAALRRHRHRRTRLSAVQPTRRPAAVPSDQQALREYVAAHHHQPGVRRLAAGVSATPR